MSITSRLFPSPAPGFDVCRALACYESRMNPARTAAAVAALGAALSCDSTIAGTAAAAASGTAASVPLKAASRHLGRFKFGIVSSASDRAAAEGKMAVSK